MVNQQQRGSHNQAAAKAAAAPAIVSQVCCLGAISSCSVCGSGTHPRVPLWLPCRPFPNQFPWFHSSTKASVDLLRGHLPLTDLFSSLIQDHFTLFFGGGGGACVCEIRTLVGI